MSGLVDHDQKFGFCLEYDRKKVLEQMLEDLIYVEKSLCLLHGERAIGREE
jgi:hypothetical protein